MKPYKKDCWKHHYLNEVICKETDIIYRRCYTCREYKPLDKEHFQVNSSEKMWFMFQCKNCRNEYKQELAKQKAKKEVEAMKEVEAKNQKQHSLFEASDTLETKLNKVLAYLWIK